MKYIGLICMALLMACGVEYINERTGSLANADTPFIPNPSESAQNGNEAVLKEYNPRKDVYCYEYAAGEFSCVYAPSKVKVKGLGGN